MYIDKRASVTNRKIAEKETSRREGAKEVERKELSSSPSLPPWTFLLIPSSAQKKRELTEALALLLPSIPLSIPHLYIQILHFDELFGVDVRLDVSSEDALLGEPVRAVGPFALERESRCRECHPGGIEEDVREKEDGSRIRGRR